MKCILLSATYTDRKAILKFYEPISNIVILWKDNTEHKPFCYVTPNSAEQIKEYPGIESLEPVSIRDVIKDQDRDMIKVTAKDPMVIGGTDHSLRENVPSWEADIKYYLTYIYDQGLNVGKWYEVSDKITAIPYQSTIDMSQVNLESVIEVEKFNSFVKMWANLLDQPIPHIRRLAFDIEVESSKDNLPDVSTANQRVTAISFESEDIHKVFMLKRDEIPDGDPLQCYNIIDKKTLKPYPYEVKWFDSEKEMLEKAFEVIENYPVVLTYNGDMFDIPYLYNRAVKLGITYIPFKPIGKNYTLSLGIHIDMYGIFSNHSMKVYTFNNKYAEEGLDSVSKALLGEGKMNYEGGLNQIPLLILAKYCYNDSRLTYKLSSYNDNMVMNLLIILCRIGNMPIDDISRLSISNWIKSMIYFTHRQNGELIPRSDDFAQVEASTTAVIGGKKYEGATVLEPEKGIHFDVSVMDFASLYPSIIKTKNISYETVRCPHEECRKNLIPETNHWACTKKMGMMALLLGSLKEVRVGHFKKLLRNAKTEKDKEVYDAITQAIKVFLIASYGVIGFESFPLYFLPTAEAITAYGRNIIGETVKKAKSSGMNVIYGDTDSMFVKKPTPEQIKSLIEETNHTYKIELEVDKEYRYVVLSNRKKNYFGVKKDGALDIKGLTGKKSHTPPFLKKLFINMMEQLKIIQKEEDFIQSKIIISNMIKSIIGGFDNIPLEQLAFKIMINKEPSEYKVKPQVIKAGEQLGKVSKGQFVSFVKTWNEPHVKPVQLVQRKEIDKEKYIESMKSTLEQVIESMDIEFEALLTGKRKTKMEEWF